MNMFYPPYLEDETAITLHRFATKELRNREKSNIFSPDIQYDDYSIRKN
jgi:hypothetical protein